MEICTRDGVQSASELLEGEPAKLTWQKSMLHVQTSCCTLHGRHMLGRFPIILISGPSLVSAKTFLLFMNMTATHDSF